MPGNFCARCARYVAPGKRPDESMVRWLAQQVRESGAKAMAELLSYDAANLAKVVAGKRKISRELRKWISEQMAASESKA